MNQILNRRSLLLGPALLLALTTGCDKEILEPAEIPNLASVQILTGSTEPLKVGDERIVQAVGMNAQGEVLPNVVARWSTPDRAILAVEEYGVVKAIAPGTGHLIATMGTKADTLQLKVVGRIATLRIEPASFDLQRYQTRTVRARGFDAAGNEVAAYPATWSSSNPAVATIDSRQRVYARELGMADIRVEVDGVHATARVSVIGERVDSIAIWPDTALVLQGGTRKLQVYHLGATGNVLSPLPVEWSSSHPETADVGSDGTITSNRPGRTTITAASGGHSATAVVETVSYKPPLVFTEVSVGGKGACGLTAEGRVYCWGDATYGQLGTSETTERCGPRVQPILPGYPASFPCSSLPRQVEGGQKFTSVSTAAGLACALAEDGVAYCWGLWASGGGAGPGNLLTPEPVSADLRFSVLNAGGNHACALTSEGAAYCWGYGSFGELGNGTITGRSAPAQVTTSLRFVDVRAGDNHSCGITSDGAAHCWGHNGSYQLGALAPSDCGPHIPCSAKPLPVAGAVRFTQVVPGGSTTCGIALDGRAYCWGAGFLLKNLTADAVCPQHGGPCVSEPAPIHPTAQFIELAAEGNTFCGLSGAGAVYCWGVERPAVRTDLPALTSISIGSNSFLICGIALDKLLYCKGSNDVGQLGTGSLSRESTEMQAVAGQR